MPESSGNGEEKKIEGQTPHAQERSQEAKEGDIQQLQIQILTTGADLLEDERNLTEEIGWKQSR